MNSRSVFAFLSPMVVFATVANWPAAAQTAAPPAAQNAPAPAVQPLAPVPTPPAVAAAPQGATGCGSASASTPGGSVVQATGETAQSKKWQAEGGDIQFTVRAFIGIPPDTSFFVCFRWKTTPENEQKFKETRPSRLERNNDGTTWTIATTVPYLDVQPKGTSVDTASLLLPLVPLAEVRIIAIKPDKSTAVDVTTAIGITYPVAALAIALVTAALGFAALLVACWRLKHSGILKANWFLRVISTPSGYASLSQLQILLWTFVVLLSAVYVMALSGQLIQITSGTLILLGIAGVAGLGAKAHNEAQGAAAEAAVTTAAQNASQAPADPKAQAELATAKAKADAFKDPPLNQTPRWSDLIVNENIATGTREIDVARFQMLLFTLITAAFVLISVVSTYVIPEIPGGFVTLMGISNGVYLGSKIAQRS